MFTSNISPRNSGLNCWGFLDVYNLFRVSGSRCHDLRTTIVWMVAMFHTAYIYIFIFWQLMRQWCYISFPPTLNILRLLLLVLLWSIMMDWNLKNVFLEISQNSHLCQRPFFNKVAGLKLSGTKSLWYRYFPVSFAKFLTPFFFFFFFFKNTSGRLLLNHTINQKFEDLQLFLDQFLASSGVHFQSGIRFSKLSEI